MPSRTPSVPADGAATLVATLTLRVWMALPREELQSMMFEEMVQLQLVMEDGSQAKEEDSAAPEAK